MISYPLVFRCFAERSEGQWQAFCIDLTLAAQADTYAEARQKLHEQINSYVFDAIAGDDQEHAVYLLQRRAPIYYRLKYQVLAICEHFRRAKDRVRCAFEKETV